MFISLLKKAILSSILGILISASSISFLIAEGSLFLFLFFGSSFSFAFILLEDTLVSKYLEDDNKKLREEAKDYLPFNAVYEIYNKLSDDVKSSLKTVFGDGVSKLSVLVNMTRNFSDFWWVESA